MGKNEGNPPDWFEQLRRYLPRLSGPDTNGNYRALCPLHEDREPSLSIHPDRGWKCFAGCGQGSLKDLADRLGLCSSSPPDGASSLTISELAQAKGLPEDLLRSVGVSDGVAGNSKNRRPCVDIPYADEAGEISAVHKRLSLQGNPRFIWRRGDHTIPYGLPRLEEIRRVGWVILNEGETDCWTLWHHDYPAIGLPGANTWKEKHAAMLQGLIVYVWHEPDQGSDSLVKAVAADLPDVRVIEAPPDAKDVSALFLLDGEKFRPSLDALLNAARPISEIRSEALGAEARDSLKLAEPLLDDQNLFIRLKEALVDLGYVGDPRPPLITYVALTSRVLEDPLNLAYISASAAGKNAAVDAPLPLFPDSAYYVVKASSPRALVYSEENFSHRTVILTESDSLPEDGPAASAIRSLMSDRHMAYEVVEKGPDGSFKVRKIEKPGPTGLITTSIKPLGEQANTRVLTVNISDSIEQTRLILEAQADRANHARSPADHRPWVALQRWLELAGERRVRVPFAPALAQLVPATAVRMRRDFPQLLITIKTVALLHQRRRERDDQGWIIATMEDYKITRWLLEEVFTATMSEGATTAVRETVNTVAELLNQRDRDSVLEKDIVRQLGLSKSTVNYRVHRAVQAGFLVNLATQKGSPARLVIGAPLPEGCPLPNSEDLLACAEHPENRSNRRTDSAESSTDQAPATAAEPIRTRFESGSNQSHDHVGTRYERFEPIEGDDTHTQDGSTPEPKNMPWDEFLNQVDSDEPDPS